MKKLILTAVLAVSIATTAFATDIKINSIAKSNFKRDFKNVTQVQWQAYGNFAFALFKKDGEIVKAYYNQDGELYGTSRTVNVQNLPVAVKRGLSRLADGYTVTDAIKFDGLEESAYFVTAEKGNEMVILKSADGVLSLHKKVRK